MNARRIIITSSAIAFAALAGLALTNARSKRIAVSTREELSTRRIELADELSRWEAKEKAARKLYSESTAIPAPTADPVIPAPAIESPPADPAITYVEWMKDPKVQVLALANARAELATGYGPFFRAQNLSSAQVEKLRDVLMKYKAFTEDIRAVSGEKGLPSGDPAIVAQREEASAELRAGANEVLGAGGYELLKNYERALPVRTFVGKIAGAASLAGVPLSLLQVETLTNLIAQTNPRYAAGGTVDSARIDWKTAEVQAQALLSPEQLKLFRASPSGSSNTKLNGELSDRVHRAYFEITGRPSENGASVVGNPSAGIAK